ncbi:unnamed protein product [Nezara viridula]|uniref:Uncharacterized protein n=1 Tax=Nezara viridula TaxID=85310 RepID=A0A9P0MPV3_NEZVI|nr:unnamed protein product [Nezara viridula]
MIPQRRTYRELLEERTTGVSVYVSGDLAGVVVSAIPNPYFKLHSPETFPLRPNCSPTHNILDKFNPGARQMINAGKAYLKALHEELLTYRPLASPLFFITPPPRSPPRSAIGGGFTASTSALRVASLSDGSPCRPKSG